MKNSIKDKKKSESRTKRPANGIWSNKESVRRTLESNKITKEREKNTKPNNGELNKQLSNMKESRERFLMLLLFKRNMLQHNHMFQVDSAPQFQPLQPQFPLMNRKSLLVQIQFPLHPRKLNRLKVKLAK